MSTSFKCSGKAYFMITLEDFEHSKIDKVSDSMQVQCSYETKTFYNLFLKITLSLTRKYLKVNKEHLRGVNKKY